MRFELFVREQRDFTWISIHEPCFHLERTLERERDREKLSEFRKFLKIVLDMLRANYHIS